MRNILLVLAGFFLPFAAAAQVPPQNIAAYNAAMSDGEKEGLADAAGALAQAAMAHPEDETAALLTFESAWTLCRLGDCSAAIAPAEFAVIQPATEAHPLMADREMLAAYVSWIDDPGRANRKRLDAALAAIVDAEPTLISIHAFQARYVADIEATDWGRLKESGAEAERHMQPIADLIPGNVINARLATIIGSFNRNPNRSAHRAIVELDAELDARRSLAISEAADGNAPQWLENIYWTTQAWSNAMTSFFNSSPQHRGLQEAEITEIYEAASVGLPEREETNHDDSGLPFCAGELLQKPQLKYPTSLARRGIVGAVITRFAIDEGQVKNVEVLASVPYGGFDQEVIETVSQWRWEKAEDQPEEPCRMSYSPVIHEFMFEIN